MTYQQVRADSLPTSKSLEGRVADTRSSEKAEMSDLVPWIVGAYMNIVICHGWLFFTQDLLQQISLWSSSPTNGDSHRISLYFLCGTI